MSKRPNKNKRYFILFIFLSIAICGAVYYEYQRPKYAYFESCSFKDGKPVGNFPLTPLQVSHRETSLRFVYHRIPITEGNPLDWRVTRIENRSSKGQYNYTSVNYDFTDATFYPIQIFHWKKDQIEYVEQALSNGVVVEKRYFSRIDNSDIYIIDFKKNVEPQITGRMPFPGSYENIKRYVCTQDENGYLSKLSYHSSSDHDIQKSITCNNDNVFGYDYELDSLHRPISLTSLDKFGRPTSDKDSILINTYEYTAQFSTPIGYYFFDINGKPKKCSAGYASNRRKIDEYGNVIESIYYDENDSICMNTSGFAMVKYSYDENGYELRRSFYDSKGKPVISKDGYANEIHRYYDSGDIAEITHTDIFDRPCNGDWGFVSIVYTYDNNHNRLTTSYFDEKGFPSQTGFNYTTHVRMYDKNNRLVEDRFLDEFGKPIVAKYLNNKGKRNEEILKFARRKFDYDENDNIICISFYDENDSLYASNNNTAILEMRYDSLSRIVERKLYGSDGKRCLGESKASGCIFQYNERNWMTQCSFLDKNDQPCINKCGYSSWKADYNDRGYPISMAFFDVKGNRCEDNTGVASWTAKYDDYGNVSECHYYGTDQMPKDNNKGIAHWMAKYDIQGNCVDKHGYNVDSIEVEFLDPTLINDL